MTQHDRNEKLITEEKY